MSDLHQLLSQGSLRFSLHIKKRPPSTRGQLDKTKIVLGSKLIRCPQNCQKHSFSLSKINNARDRRFTFQKYETTYSFCPYHNEKMQMLEGGIPRFNNDRKIQTPSFVLKYQTITDSESIYEQRFKDVLARATNQTLYPQQQKCKVLEERKYSGGKKHLLFEKQIEQLKEILIRKDERNRKNE